VITEILLAGLLRPNFRLNSKSCITYLYVDVKEPAEPDGSWSVWLLEFLLSVKLKTVVVCLIFSSMVGVAGFEPATLRLSSACSNQLSYTPIGKGMVEAWGFEPQTYSLQSYRSTN
jgi:hypothetical protein